MENFDAKKTAARLARRLARFNALRVSDPARAGKIESACLQELHDLTAAGVACVFAYVGPEYVLVQCENVFKGVPAGAAAGN